MGFHSANDIITQIIQQLCKEISPAQEGMSIVEPPPTPILPDKAAPGLAAYYTTMASMEAMTFGSNDKKTSTNAVIATVEGEEDAEVDNSMVVANRQDEEVVIRTEIWMVNIATPMAIVPTPVLSTRIRD